MFLRELVVREANELRGTIAPIAYLSIKVLWQPHIEALLDICVIETDTQSYVNI